MVLPRDGRKNDQMSWLQNLLYRMNIGKIRTIDAATRAIREGNPRHALTLLGGIELKVNIRFRYLYYLVLGAAHLSLRQLPAAQNCFEEVIALEKQNGQGYFQLAIALARRGEIAQAIERYTNGRYHFLSGFSPRKRL